MAYKKDVAPNQGGDENQDDDSKSDNHGNLGLPFGLCAKYGIPLPENATPRDAWDALKEKRGIKPPWKSEGERKVADNTDGEENKKERSLDEQYILDVFESSGVEKQEVKKGARLSSEAIVEKIAGGDMTGGSCASLCLAYIANSLGYDVTDFRGGKSQKLFSEFARKIISLPEIGSEQKKSKSDTSTAWKLMQGMEAGKEYMLITGRHAAMVRKKDEGFEYLELQSGKENGNGWKELDAFRLKWRFGARDRGKYEFPTSLSEASKFANIDMPSICAYLQTATDKQRKGENGNEK